MINSPLANKLGNENNHICWIYGGLLFGLLFYLSPNWITWAEPNDLTPCTRCCHVSPSPGSYFYTVGCRVLLDMWEWACWFSYYSLSISLSPLSLSLSMCCSLISLSSPMSSLLVRCGSSRFPWEINLLSELGKQSLRLLVSWRKLGFGGDWVFYFEVCSIELDLVWGDCLVKVLVVWGWTLTDPSVLPWILFWSNISVWFWQVLSQSSSIYSGFFVQLFFDPKGSCVMLLICFFECAGSEVIGEAS